MRKKETKKEKNVNLVMPDVVGEAIEDAEKILKEKNIEITEVKKKFDLFTKKDYVIKTEPEVGENVEDKVVVTISRMKLLPLLLLCVLFAFGGLIFGTGTISRVFTTSAPVIESKTHEWTKSGIVVVTKDAKMIDEVKKYEYCVTKRKTTIGCKWEKTETKNVEITKSGVWSVYFRGIDLRGRKSKVSNRDYVRVDNDAPIIDGLNINNNKVVINAYDKHSGINKIYYSFDGENYTETDKIFDLKSNVKTIYIKVVDKVGNETVLSKNINAFCDLNCDIDNDGKCDLNCDTNDDGKCDLNCDTNDDGKCDLNCDTNNDRKCDLNCSTDKTNNSTTTKTKPTTTELIDNEVPIINLNKVPSKFIYGSKYDLPSYYKFGPKGGKVKCIIDGTDEKTDTSDLSIGKHNIVCTAYGNNGINVRVSKMVEVNVSEGEEETWDGWIRLNLYYPLNSTNWQWRIGKEGEIRNGYDFSGWQDYTGPILIKLEDVKDVYIRYDLLGETYVIAPNGRIAVDIEPEQYTIEKGQKTKVKIYYEKDALTKEYRIGSSDWMNYTGEFEVGPNTLIEARSTKEEKVYNSDGEYLYSKKIKGTDSVFISELISLPGISINPSDDRYYGKIDGGIGEGSNGIYGPSQREDGSYITAPDIDFKPSEYLAGPIITGTPSSTLTDKVKINVSTKDEAETIYVKIGSNEYKEYTGEFEVTNNTTIYAYYIRKNDGKISDTSHYKVKNIRYGYKPYVRIEANPDYLSNSVNEVTVAISGSNYDTLEYSLDGYIYQKYTGEIKVKTSTTIYAKGTNSYGVTIEKEYITTKNAPASKKNLAIEIFTDPSKTDKLINKTKVSIDYDPSAEKKYYKLAGDTEYREYTGSFEITKNTTVYAYATSKNGVGYKEKGIDFLTTGIMAPIITVTPSTNANMVKVSIDFDKNANKKYYQIDNGEKLYYTGEFEIYENSNIYAYNSNSLGYEADALKEISNINKNLRYYIIDKGKYFIIKLNYPSGASVREYKWKQDGVWKNYEDIGILLIKTEYKDEFNLDGYDGIKVEDENGKDVIFTDHYYLIDVPFSKLMENLFMRWDKTKPASPEIMIEPDDKNTKEVKVIINYSKSLEKKYYKLVNEKGDSTGWISYNGPFNVSKNGVIIYAKGETYTEIESEIVSRKITNIDNDAPVINVNGDFDTPKQKLNLFIGVTDKSSIDRIKYVKGNRNIDYFKNNGNIVDNFSSLTIDGNGEYTIYAIDELGNATVKVIKVTNIDKDAPNIEIIVKAKTKTIETEVEIDYGDSMTKQYKIGENGEYKEYTDILTLKTSELYNLKNEDGSLTIYAKGTDEAGNEREVQEITYILDLDEISAPVLNLSDGYPMLTRDGMIDEKPSYISYDTKDDIQNTYKIDDEEYKEYTGPIIEKTGKVTARSERKSSGQVVETTGSIVVPSNAIGKNTYDKDLQTSETIGRNANKIFTINSSLYGEKVKIYTGSSVSTTSTIKLYDKDKKLLDTITTVGVVTIVEFKEDTYFVEINAGSAALEIKEIELIGERYINDEYTPIISIDESKWAAEKIATIKYYSDEYTNEYTNEYSLDNGITWNAYEGPIKLTEPTNVIARTTREGIVLGSSNFIITKIDPTEPVIELNIANKIQLGYDQAIPTYYKQTLSGTTVECKTGNTVVTNIKELKEGEHKIVCTAKTGAGKKASVEKNVKIIDMTDFVANSLLEAISNEDIATGKYKIQVNDEVYPVHVITLDGNQHFTENQTFGNAKDVATKDTYAQNMVIVKVNGDLEIDSGVIVSPYYDKSYGGPKGFTLYVTGKLINNGTIDNSHGAKAEGQNVYLWKNTDGTYEYVPAEGGAGGARSSASSGQKGEKRQTAGGGAGSDSYGGSGSSGTSYSGGTGGGASSINTTASNAKENGGQGGNGYGFKGVNAFYASTGVGNPTGKDEYFCNLSPNGTGGLLTIYANEYENKGMISAKGTSAYSAYYGGGSSGGGSINIFYINKLSDGTANVNGGSAAGERYKGGAGGKGTVTYTQLLPLSFTLSHTYPNLTESKFEKETNIVTINYSSTLKDKLYSLDDGNSWLNYKKPFAVNPNDKILAKATNKDNSETEVITYIVPETDGIPYNSYDGTTSEKAILEANKDYEFTVSSKVEGRNLRFFLGSEVSTDASIKVYDKSNKELLSTTFVNNLTVINIPEETYKFVINGGSKELTINEINLREEKDIVNEIPIIETNDTGWSVEKIIDITYPEGYEKEYSLDLGETWNRYENPITINKETIIFARTIKDGKVVTTNSYIINKIDTTEPVIELEIPEEVTQNDSYELPTKVTYGKSEGTVVCKANEKEVKNTNELEEGENTITCIATSGSGKTSKISKKVTLVKVSTLKDALLSREIITTEPTLTTSSNNTEDTSGLYKSTETNSGEPTYYFRGNVEDNYVSFAGQTWRIVRINEDGTIRLIMQNGINDNQSYVFNSNYSDYSKMYYSNSEAKTALENWYNTNIENNEIYSKQVVTGAYFCEQAKVKYNSNYTSGAATMTVYTSYTPNFKCETDGNGKGIVNSNIGLITYDEAVYAGGYFLQSNNNYYLYTTPSLSWTMSPSGVYDYISNVGDIAIYFSGEIGDHYVSYDHDSTGKYPIILRPVINLKSDTVMVGLGTIDNPYVVK